MTHRALSAFLCKTIDESLILSKVGMDGKIFGTQSWHMDLAMLDPYAVTSSRIFSHPALPLSQ